MCHVFVAYLGTVRKDKNFTLLKIFREISLQCNSLWNAVISRNFCKTDESMIIIPTNGFLVLWPQQQWENQIICLQFKFYVKLQSLFVKLTLLDSQSEWYSVEITNSIQISKFFREINLQLFGKNVNLTESLQTFTLWLAVWYLWIFTREISRASVIL